MRDCIAKFYDVYRLISNTIFPCQNWEQLKDRQRSSRQCMDIKFTADKADLAEFGFAVKLSSFFRLC